MSTAVTTRPLEDAEHEHPEEGETGPHDGAAPDVEEAPQLANPEEAGDGHDHDRPERRLREILEERCQKGTGEQDQPGRREGGEL